MLTTATSNPLIMKFTSVLLLTILLSLKGFAQNNAKTIIGVIPFDYNESSYKKQAEQLQNMVTRILNANNRISLLDRSKVAVIQKELNLQKNKEYINGKTVKQNKAYGAQFIIIGVLTNIVIEKTKFSGINPFDKSNTGATTSKCKISFTLQKIDVTTGVLNATKMFDLSTSGSIETANYKKDVDPFNNAVQVNAEKINNEVRSWVAKLFPPVLNYHGVEEKDKKGLPRYVTLIADNDSPVEPGDLISMLEIEDIDFEGTIKHRKSEVALVKVKEIQGDIIKCTILTGAKVIEEKINGKNKTEFIKKVD
jgi:hypothetical protein